MLDTINKSARKKIGIARSLLIQSLADSWALRRLTMIGKVYVIKSELIFENNLLCHYTRGTKGNSETIRKYYILNFFGIHQKKIKRKVLTSDYEFGGLKMIDIEMQFRALKSAWIPRYLRDRADNAPWCIFPDIYFQQDGITDKLLKMNFLNEKMFPYLKKLPSFYREVVTSFNMSKDLSIPSNSEEILESVLWGNRYFTYRVGKCAFVIADSSFSDVGIIKVKDLKIYMVSILPCLIFKQTCQ